MSRRWFITGCSDGLGFAIARAALAVGDTVIATARRAGTLEALLGDPGGDLQCFELDITDAGQIERAVTAAGRIDVLVNNAGHGYLAAVEEGEDERIRRTFEINFFGVAALIRAVLPGMRAQACGTIVNISSIAGFSAGAGSAYYAASKYALEGLSDALIAEVGPMGIRVLIVEPGPIRTNFAGRSILRSPAIPAYSATAGTRQQQILGSHGTQAGDPDAIAQLIVAAVSEDAPVQRIIVGKMAALGVERKLAQVARDLALMRERGLATDFR